MMVAVHRRAERQQSLEHGRPTLQVVKDRRKKRRVPALVLVCGIAFLCVTLALLYLGQQLSAMRLSVHIAQLHRDHNLALEEQERLQLELYRARSLRTIESIARHQLGMVEPAQANVVLVPPTTIESVTGDGWLEQPQEKTTVFQAVADWLNQWLPWGGVEAGPKND